MYLRSSLLLGLFLALAAPPLAAQTWQQSTTTFPTGMHILPSVAFGNGTFVAAGMKTPINGTIYVHTSTDGATWTERAIDLAGFSLLGSSKVRFVNNQFVVFGAGWLGGLPRGYTATSADGATWTLNDNSLAITAIHFTGGEDTYVITAGTDMRVSTDHGVTWSTVMMPSGGTANAGWGDVAYSSGRWYMTGEGFSPKWWTSTDGSTWTETTAAGTGGARIEAGNGIFIRYVGSYRRSTDGVTFTEITPAPLDNGVNRNLVFFGGRFMIDKLVFNSTTPSVQFIASTDGLTYSNFGTSPVSSFGLVDAAQGNNVLVAVGTNSQPGANARALALYSAAPAEPDVLPTISTQPVAESTAPGGSVTFSVSANGNNLTYQWKLGTQAISGATSASLTIDNVDSSDAGTYTVEVTNSAGTVTSSGATLTVLTPAQYGRLSALAIRAQVGTGDNVLIAGYAIGPGSSSLPVLVRAVGPSLSSMGVPSASTLQDPQISIVPPGQSVAVASNDDWAGNADVLAKSAELGAQPFASNTSTDAGVYLTGLAPGPYTAVVSGKNNGTGIGMVEVYSGSNASDAPRLTAISGRSTIGAGNDVLIAGFVVHGASTRVLVRGVGPSLVGVATRLADPQIAIHAAGSTTAIATNNDWGSAANASDAATLAAQVGATAFTSGSKDAAMLVTLEPGVYTAVVSGVGSSSGIAVVEVYEVP